MKTPFMACVVAAFSACAQAEENPPGAPLPPPPAAANLPALSPEKLDELLGPIALYPDALIAVILPASTVPSDIVLAARFQQAGGKPEEIEEQPWDDSVRALAHYPDIITWMDKNLTWTKQLGEAFLAQPADVMNSLQRLRAQARASGALVDTPQQKVIIEKETIVIAPAEPDVIYVPYYDPSIVYARYSPNYSGAFVTFGVGYATGYWLGYDFDWHRHRVWAVDPLYRQRYWQDRHRHYYWHHRDYHRPDHNGDPHTHPWRPRPNHPRPPRHDNHGGNRPPPQISRPAPFPRQVARPPGTPEVRPGPSPSHGRDGNRDHHNPRGQRPTTRPVSTEPSTSAITPTNSLQPTTPVMGTTTPPQVERRRPSQGEQRPPRIDNAERPRRERSENRPDTPRPRPQPRVDSTPQPTTAPVVRPAQPPPTGRTGLPQSQPRENRPPPPPSQRIERTERPQNSDRSSGSMPSRSAPPAERRPVDTPRDNQEREQR